MREHDVRRLVGHHCPMLIIHDLQKVSKSRANSRKQACIQGFMLAVMGTYAEGPAKCVEAPPTL